MVRSQDQRSKLADERFGTLTSKVRWGTQDSSACALDGFAGDGSSVSQRNARMMHSLCDSPCGGRSSGRSRGVRLGPTFVTNLREPPMISRWDGVFIAYRALGSASLEAAFWKRSPCPTLAQPGAALLWIDWRLSVVESEFEWRARCWAGAMSTRRNKVHTPMKKKTALVPRSLFARALVGSSVIPICAAACGSPDVVEPVSSVAMVGFEAGHLAYDVASSAFDQSMPGDDADADAEVTSDAADANPDANDGAPNHNADAFAVADAAFGDDGEAHQG